jgi:GT2 family glycosyltransferase
MVGWSDNGSVHGIFAFSLLRMQQMELALPSDEYDFVMPQRTSGLYVQQNRNELVKTLLDSDADWLLQLDGDESFRPELLRMMMRTASENFRPIVVGLYSNVSSIDASGVDGGIMINNMIYGETEHGEYMPIEPPEDLVPFEVHAAGTGVMLVHRRVFETIEEPWFWVEMFQSPAKADWQFMNEDIAFCRKAREAGFKIWCDPLAEVVHWKTMPLMPSTTRTYLKEADRVFSEMRG